MAFMNVELKPLSVHGVPLVIAAIVESAKFTEIGDPR
jgi:hypothetical protein